MRIDPLHYEGEEMRTTGPTDGIQNAPALPDYFCERRWLNDHWHLPLHSACFLLDFWVKACDTGGGALEILFIDQVRRTRICLDISQKRVYIARAIGNGTEEATQAALPMPWDSAVFHHILIQKAASQGTLYLDEEKCMDFDCGDHDVETEICARGDGFEILGLTGQNGIRDDSGFDDKNL